MFTPVVVIRSRQPPCQRIKGGLMLPSSAINLSRHQRVSIRNLHAALRRRRTSLMESAFVNRRLSAIKHRARFHRYKLTFGTWACFSLAVCARRRRRRSGTVRTDRVACLLPVEKRHVTLGRLDGVNLFAYDWRIADSNAPTGSEFRRARSSRHGSRSTARRM